LAQSRHPVSDIPAGKTFDFLTFNFLTFDFLTNGFASGVSEFEIIGIDPGVNPTDITAFVTGLTFTMDGSFTGTMQPIVEETTPVPAALLLFGTSLGALGLLGWRRKRKAPAVA
jgi:hypothetical protein